jgi:hypothetical protein
MGTLLQRVIQSFSIIPSGDELHACCIKAVEATIHGRVLGIRLGSSKYYFL